MEDVTSGQNGSLPQRLGQGGNGLYAADIDRFFVVDISRKFNSDYITDLVESKLDEMGLSGRPLAGVVADCLNQAFALYQAQGVNGLYPYNRLGRPVIEAFLKFQALMPY